MKKIAFAVLIAIVAASPALAARRRQRPLRSRRSSNANDNGYRFVHDSMPIYWPSALKMAVYYTPGANQAAATTHHKKKQ